MGKPWSLQHSIRPLTLLFLVYFTIVDLRPMNNEHPRSKRDVELYPEENLESAWFFQGDIVLSRRRNAVSNFHLTWVNRTVPYVMGSLDAHEQHMVEEAMEEIMNKSCVRFVPRTKQTDYISIIKTDGCYSSVGRIGGQQQLNLNSNCYEHGLIVHELMHALGFWHEHSRPDRDDYITIMWDNISPRHRSNFEKYGEDVIDTLGAPYDYGSIMHYRNNTFARDRNRITINHTQPLPPGVEMGQRIGLSDIDVIKLKRLYKCNITHCLTPGEPQNGFKLGDSLLVGASVAYSCSPGYQLYGSRGRSCLDQGTWTGHLPSCLPDQRGELLMCNFDNQQLCGWLPDPHSPINWTLHFRATPSNETGPEEDHTMGTAEGWYIYLEASNRKAGERARLLSPTLRFGPQSPEVMCLMFYYSMHGQGLGTLNVYQRTVFQAPGSPYNDTLLFNMTGEQGTDWKLAAITLPPSEEFLVVLEAVVGHNFQSDIAVDDVVIGPCSRLTDLEPSAVAETFHCSFDTGLCGLEQDKLNDDFDWTRHANDTGTYGTGPDCDPLHCESGYYMYTEASWPRRPSEKARLITPLLHGDGPRCVQFYWNMRGSGMGSLMVKDRQLNGTERVLWSQTGPQDRVWHLEQLDIAYIPPLYKLVFEGVIGPSFTSDMAIDNIEVWIGSCQEVVRNDCTFEMDLCSWQNTGQRQWQRNYRNTPTPGTGPTLGHNNISTEYYLYVESSRTFPNDSARLTSGEMSGNMTGYCLQFWYHMYGANIGELSVLAHGSSSDQEVTVWQHSGSAGDVWHREAVYYTNPGREDFRIIFQARLAGGSLGDIAIDDILIHAGQCETPDELSLL